MRHGLIDQERVVGRSYVCTEDLDELNYLPADHMVTLVGITPSFGGDRAICAYQAQNFSSGAYRNEELPYEKRGR